MHSEAIKLRTKAALHRMQEAAAQLAALFGLSEQAQKLEAAAQKLKAAARRGDQNGRDVADLAVREAVADLLDKIADQVAAGQVPARGRGK